jgi:hypothetical protein
MVPAETAPWIGGGGIKGSGGEGEFKFKYIYLIHCKNLCKCCSVPLPNTTIKEKNQKIIILDYVL